MINLPVSKSLGARFLVATYFAGTLPADPFFEDNEDLMVLQQALLEIFSDEEPIDYGDSPIDVGSSGTALRFVAAVCASSPGADYVINGSPRLMRRPMLPMIDLLRKAGATIEILGPESTGPYRVKGAKIEGGDFSIRADISSQFISAAMLVSPYWEKGMKLTFTTDPVSKPYIDMTAKLMEKMGIKVKLDTREVEIKPGNYREPFGFKVEADWSAAAFFYEACALGAKDVIISNLVAPDKSLQGDSSANSIFKKLGVRADFSSKETSLSLVDEKDEKVEIDFTNFPDLLLPFAVASLLSDTKFRFTGLSHIRLKESDRIESLKSEASKLGYCLSEGEEFIEWEGETSVKEDDPVIDPHDDHRVAMAFAIAALKTGRIKIAHPEVVEKSFINFWNQLPEIGLACENQNGVMIVKK